MQELILSLKINKETSLVMSSGIPVTIYELKDILKIIRSVQNREISLKGTNEKVNNQEEGLLSKFFIH